MNQALYESQVRKAERIGRLAADEELDHDAVHKVAEETERLREKEFGVLDRLTRFGVEEHHPEQAEMRRILGKFYHRPPGGESWCDVILRLRGFYRELDPEYPGERVLVVAHDAVVVLTRYIIERLTEHQVLEIERTPVANCSLSRWLRRDGRLRPAEYNDTAHLREPSTEPAPGPAP